LEDLHPLGGKNVLNSAPPLEKTPLGWIGLSSVLRPRQHSIVYIGDGFYRSKDPTNSIKVLKEKSYKEKQLRPSYLGIGCVLCRLQCNSYVGY